MISVVISTQGIEQPVVATLAALVPGAAAGIVRDVVLVDRTNSDIIARVADMAGCNFLNCNGTQAEALAAGAKQTRSPWLMFLHAGAVLDSGWFDETAQFIQNVATNGRQRAGVFRYARSPYADGGLRHGGLRHGGLRHGLKWLARAITGPSTEQGLLIARDHYERLGGYMPNVRRAEARLLRRVGRSSRTTLRSRIIVV